MLLDSFFFLSPPLSFSLSSSPYPVSFPFLFLILPLLTPGAVGQEKDWNQLRKQVHDNMSAYLARKEERIRLKAVEGVTELPEPDLFSEPPDKKIRIDNE